MPSSSAHRVDLRSSPTRRSSDLIGNVLVRFDFSRAVRALAALSDVADETDALRLLEAAKLRYEDGQIPRADFLREAFRIKSARGIRSEEHTSELQSRGHLVCRLLPPTA